MKDYLSSDERKHMARLGAIISTADDAVEDYSKLKGVDKDFLKSLRMMGSFALTLMNLISTVAVCYQNPVLSGGYIGCL